MYQESVKIIMPLPSPYLSPNRPTGSHGSRMRKMQIAKKQRKLARELIKNEQIESGPWSKATIQAFFYHKQKRKRDGVNFNAMLKSAQDGIVDAGLIVDDNAECLTTLPPVFNIDKEFPRVELLVINKS